MVEELYGKYHIELVKWCLKMTGNSRTAEELVQEAFLRAIQNEALLFELDDKKKRAWLYRTAKNIYIDRLRRASREVVVESLPENQRVCEEMTAVEWKDLLASLPDMEGLIFSLRYLEGLSSNQIGDMLDLPSGTVRFKLSLARQHLRAALKGTLKLH